MNRKGNEASWMETVGKGRLSQGDGLKGTLLSLGRGCRLDCASCQERAGLCQTADSRLPDSQSRAPSRDITAEKLRNIHRALRLRIK